MSGVSEVATLKEYTHKDYIFHFRRKGLDRPTFCKIFYENRLIDFVDMAMFLFLSN